MNPISVVWVLIICTVGLLPTNNLGVPWLDGFDWTYVNYAPIVLFVVIGLAAIGWIRARHHFTGQVRTVQPEDLPLETSAP
jgi:hypothetical protein